MNDSVNRRLTAWAVALALLPATVKADSRLSRQEGAVVLSEGLRARISDRRLRRARLVFNETYLDVEVNGDSLERFDYGELRILGGRHRTRLPLFKKTNWLVFLPPTCLYLLTSGIATGAICLLGLLGVTHVAYFWDRFSKSHGAHWLSLHSDSQHRCVFLALPRKKEARRAIFEELERRDNKELLARPEDPRGQPEIVGIPMIGETAPDFIARTLDGSPWRVSESRGKVILLNFWATWCEPCLRELPQLERLHRKFSQDGLAVIGVSGEEPREARQFLSENGIGYLALHDQDGEVHRRYRVNAIPTTLVIGRDGTLQERIEGYANGKAFAKAVLPYLSPTRDSATW